MPKKSKVCSKCKEEKSLSDFYKDKRSKDGRSCWCASCARTYRNNWRREHPEKHRESNRKRHSGMTGIEFEKLLVEQNNCCAICGRYGSEFKKELGGDHNHITGEKRGLLCPNCNVALGLFNTDEWGVDILCSAISYMRQYE